MCRGLVFSGTQRDMKCKTTRGAFCSKSPYPSLSPKEGRVCFHPRDRVKRNVCFQAKFSVSSIEIMGSLFVFAQSSLFCSGILP